MKRQPTEREKTFENHVFDKWLISKIYLETHTTQQQINPKLSNFKMGRGSG